jgi:hypothetical protein
LLSVVSQTGCGLISILTESALARALQQIPASPK